MTCTYRLFGLNVQSEIDLPDLVATSGKGAPDVTISIESIGAGVWEPGIHVIDGDLLFVAKDVARYRISKGARIAVEPLPGVPERNVRLFLLGSAFGALLHQRGLLPLHANAIEIDGKAVAFMGQSGAGKSSLAAWFYDRGYGMLADDVCVVGFGDGSQPRVFPGLPRLRLWADALTATGRSAADHDRSYIQGSEVIDKFDVLTKPAGTVRSSVPLCAVYLLERGDTFSVRSMLGLESAEAVIANTYRGSYLAAINGQRNHWEAAVRLVRSVPMYRVVRPWDLSNFNEQCARLSEHAVSLVAASRDSDISNCRIHAPTTRQ